jgi:hypothetical protein
MTTFPTPDESFARLRRAGWTVGNAFGMGDKARASRDRPVAALRWRRAPSAQFPSPGRAVKVQNPVASRFRKQQRDLSLRNSRGDKTPIELYLAGIADW